MIDPEMYEKALEMSERTGMGVERCMVELQHGEAERDSLQEFLEAFQAWAQTVVAAFEQLVTPAIDAASKVLQDLSDQLEAPPQQQVCPSHGRALRGGRCLLCDRGRN